MVRFQVLLRDYIKVNQVFIRGDEILFGIILEIIVVLLESFYLLFLDRSKIFFEVHIELVLIDQFNAVVK